MVAVGRQAGRTAMTEELGCSVDYRSCRKEAALEPRPEKPLRVDKSDGRAPGNRLSSPHHSSRSRIIGSTARACRAGIHAARRPTAIMVSTTPPMSQKSVVISGTGRLSRGACKIRRKCLRDSEDTAGVCQGNEIGRCCVGWLQFGGYEISFLL